MMNESITPGQVRPFRRWRDEGTELERLPAVVLPVFNALGSQRGQTRMTFVENESTDDE